ncbi:DUF4156 domain-containing protein [Thiohalophilus sp.]|uniref:DUF4156 domain-containing protein n=1 Tax=Thiohalophilus sp. TaxID=3028392 RepID=UPI002ACDCAFD|nr:DUF4156 domain-containing protein [Thiohalophilus sp.]MDZ7663411.1 DUF4156 domain-containing protein [Thiohalophilus sp.]
MKKLLVVLALVALQGCSWVKLDPAAEQVKVVETEHVEGCKLMGKTTVSVKSTVAGVERKEATMQDELETLARNHAVDLKGDTIVAISGIENGKRVYNVYRCKQAD